MAWNGNPVLALIDAAQIPAVPVSPALHGLAAGFMAALAVAVNHTPAGELGFTLAVREARQHEDYGYSREFLAGVEMVKAELAKAELSAAPKEIGGHA